MLEILKRFKSPAVWAGIISIFTIIIQGAGIKVAEITSWSILLNEFIKIVSNPYILISIIVAIIVFLNNPTESKKF